MGLEIKLRKVKDPGDPKRCQATIKTGQCPFEAIEGSSNCKMHYGQMDVIRQEKKNIRSYRASVWQNRINQLSDSPTVKTLREEIGIARLTLESILLKCESSTELLIYSGKISQMLGTIQGLVISCNRLEDRLGFTLDRSAVINIATEIVQAVGQFVPEEKMDELANHIEQVIVQATSKE